MSRQDRIDFVGASALFLTVAVAGVFFGSKKPNESDSVQAESSDKERYEDHWYEFRSPEVCSESGE